MTELFQGFTPRASDWFAGITANNSREYFTAHRSLYDEVRGQFTQLLTELSHTYGGRPKIFRPNRDIRFSPDKTPYKTNVSGYLDEGPGGAIYYIDVSFNGLLAATGYYQMASDQLARYREALTVSEDSVKNGEKLRKIIAKDNVECEGLKTVPRGVAKDAPNRDLVGFKTLIISSIIPIEDCNREKAFEHINTIWHRGDDLNAWLNKHVGPSLLAE